MQCYNILSLHYDETNAFLVSVLPLRLGFILIAVSALFYCQFEVDLGLFAVIL
jgi:hypothetical protein